MSYDYMLARGNRDGGVEGFAEGMSAKTIGSADDIKAAITRLFPSVQWNELRRRNAETDMDTSAWFGLGGPAEFHLTLEPDGEVRVITMSHCDRDEVERVCAELGLIALDEQTMELLG